MIRFVSLLLFSMLGMVCFASETKSEAKEEKKVSSYQKEADVLLEKFSKMEISEEAMKTMEEGAKEINDSFEKIGLQVGEKAPSFILKNYDGKEVSLDELLKKGPVIISFFRGNWCPFCQIETKVLWKTLPEFSKKGATLVLISPQMSEKSAEFKKNFPGDFYILSDADDSVSKNYHLFHAMPEKLTKLYKEGFQIDLEAHNGKGRTALPVPGTFVVGKDGLVKAAMADTDYKKRMEPQAILDALE